MTTPPLPDRWEDEPWPLDDPVPAPSFRPVNWSDTHAQPPQVADLADEAWQYAVDHGISMERALAELQHLHIARASAAAAAARVNAHVARLGPDLIGRDMRVTFHASLSDPAAPTPQEIQAGDDLSDLIRDRILHWVPTRKAIDRLIDPGNGA